MSFIKARRQWARFVRKTYKSLRSNRLGKRKGIRNWLAKGVVQRELWRPSRHRVALGLSLGVAVGMLPPLPIQTVLAIALAVRYRANIPAAATAVWISNPATAVPLFIYQCKVGKTIFNFNDKYGGKELDFDIQTMSFATFGVLISAVVLAPVVYFVVYYVWGLGIMIFYKSKKVDYPQLSKNDSDDQT